MAISMDRGALAVVLQADGRVVSFDTAQAVIGSEIYQVPKDYHASDLAATSQRGGTLTSLTLNGQSSPRYASFLLQLLPDRREVWTFLPQRGVYIGVALDGTAGFAYVTNSSNNGIYRVVLGNDKAPVTEIARVDEAERLGALAIDTAGRRLFVADSAAARVYVVPLTKQSRLASIDLAEAEEIRAVAWNATAHKLYIADSGQEAVWSVDPDRRGEPGRLLDRRLREPSGLTAAADGTMWLVDEGARMVFQISTAQNAILRAVPFTARATSRR